MSSATIQDGTTQSITEHLSALERSLLDPDIRADRNRVANLLSDDFVEFGSSGRIWTKETTVADLSVENPGASTSLTLTDLRVRLLAEEAALVTYALSRQPPGEANVQTLRSSIWQREAGTWRMVFHQGTHRRGEN